MFAALPNQRQSLVLLPKVIIQKITSLVLRQCCANSDPTSHGTSVICFFPQESDCVFCSIYNEYEKSMAKLAFYITLLYTLLIIYTQRFIFLNLPSNQTHQASQRPALEGPKVPGSLRALRLDTVDDHHIR